MFNEIKEVKKRMDLDNKEKAER
jgi:hypothetical protein